MNIRIPPQEDRLSLEGLETIGIDDASYEDEIFYRARSTVAPPRMCPQCGADSTGIHRHGVEEGTFKDVVGWSKMVSIVVARQRWRCTECSKTWIEKIPSLHERRMMTVRLEDHIAKRCLTRATNMSIAREHGIDEGSVRSIFKEFAGRKAGETPFTTPRVLGIDEIHLATIPCVLTDIENKTIFDILPSRTKDNIAPYFAALPEKERVEVVVADMWRPYHAMADEFFPLALPVVDRFHVVRMAVNGFDEVRKSISRTRSEADRIRLKDERHLMYARKATLTAEESDRVREWLRAFPRLREAYAIKERFSAAYDEPNRKAGTAEMDRAILSIPAELDPYFKELITAYGNWKPRITNYFEQRFTNAFTESVNSLIREMDRTGRGYSFEVMRARLLFREPPRLKKTSTRKRRPATRADDVMGFFDYSDILFDDASDDGYIRLGPRVDKLTEWLASEPTPEPDKT